MREESGGGARRASRLLTYKEAAERLAISETALRKRVSVGKIPRIQLGPRSCRIDEEELERYIEQGRQGRLWIRNLRDRGEGASE